MAETDKKGRAIVDDTFLILLNAHHTTLPFTLPAHKRGVRWQQLLDTDSKGVSPKHVTVLKGGERYEVEARSVRVLRLVPAGSTRRDL
jgi:glycogen operon protein